MATNFYKQGGSYYTTAGQKILNLTELQGFAKAGGKEVAAPVAATPQIPQGAVDIPGAQYNTRDKQLAAFTNIQPIGNTLYGVPKVPEQMPEVETKKENVIVPVAPEQTDYNKSFLESLSGAGKSLEDYLSKTNEPLPEQKSVDIVSARVQELLGQTGKVGERRTELQTQLGVPEQTKQLAELNTQIASRAAQFKSLMEQNANLPISSRIIGGTQDRLTRQAGVELGALTSLAQAMQGNIEMAKQTASDTVEFEFAPIEAQLNQQLQQLEASYSALTRVEQRRADDRTLAIKQYLGEIEGQKEIKNNIAEIMVAASKNGASQDILKKIMAATNYGDAVIAAGPYLMGPQTLPSLPTPVVNAINYSGTTANEIANAIKMVEGGGNYNAKGGSGESGAYQFMPATWKQYSGEYLNSIGKAGQSLSMTPENQDTVALYKIQGWIDQGYSADQIASIWNSGKPNYEGNVGINSKGIRYDVPAYVNKVLSFIKPVMGTTDNEVVSYAQQVASGKLTAAQALNEVTPSKKTMLIEALATTPTPQDTESETAAKQKIKLLDEILVHPGLNNAVGPNRLARLGTPLTGSKKEFIGNVEQLISQETLNTLLELKKGGGTLGALSDQERIMLQNAATKIGGWKVLKNGMVMGYAVSEDAFKKEIRDIKMLAEKAVKNSSLPEVQTMPDGTVWQDNGDGTFTQIK